MTAGELAVVLAALLCCIGFAALVVVLMRVLDSLKALRGEVESLRCETRPCCASSAPPPPMPKLRWRRPATTSTGSIGCSAPRRPSAVRWPAAAASLAALSAPVIKTVAIGTGTRRAVRRLGRKEKKIA